MFAFLSNPLILFAILTPILLLIGILVGVILARPAGNTVIQFAPESGRATEFRVKEEDAINLRSDPVGNIPPQRFIKLHDAYTVVYKGWIRLKSYALWLGRKGTAYTYQVKLEPVKLTLKKAMLNIFGEKLYEQIPEGPKKKIESGEIAVTVEFPEVPLTPQDMPSLSSDDLRRGDIDHFIDSLARGIAKLTSGTGITVKDIFIIGTGIAIGVILSLVFQWGAPVIVN